MKSLKRIMSVLVVLCLVLSMVASAVTGGGGSVGGTTLPSLQSSENLVSNPSFEFGEGEPDGGWYLVNMSGNPWTVSWDELWVEEDGDDGEYLAHEGNKFIRFPIRPPGSGVGAGSVCQLVKGLEGGKSYELSAWFRGSNAASHPGTSPVNAKMYVIYYKTYEYNGSTVTTTLDEWAANTGGIVTGEKEIKPFYPPKVINAVPEWYQVGYTFTLNPLADAVEIQFFDNVAVNTLSHFDNVSLVHTDNMISNPGFEYRSGFDPEGTALDWLTSKTGAYTKEDTRSGEWAAAVGSVGLSQSILGAKPGAKYKLSFWYKITSGTVAPQVYITFRTKGVSLPVRLLPNPASESPGGWKKYICTFNTPEDMETMALGILTGAAIRMYDDFELMEITDQRDFIGFSTEVPKSRVPSPSPASGSFSECPESVTADAYGYYFVPVESLTTGEEMYVSAYAPSGAAAVMMICRFSESDGVKLLEEIKLVNPSTEGGLFYDSITIPETGNYTLEAFLWGNINTGTPISQKIEVK